jgi:hypothetical protein
MQQKKKWGEMLRMLAMLPKFRSVQFPIIRLALQIHRRMENLAMKFTRNSQEPV